MQPCLTRIRHQTDRSAVSVMTRLCARAGVVSAVSAAALVGLVAPARANT